MAITAKYKKEKIALVEKEKKKKTVEELIEKSKKAFNSKLIVEIVEKASVNKDGKVNLTKTHDQVFEYILEQTKDLKMAKEFAVAGRWLAMLKRDYPDVFQRGIDIQKFSEGFQKEIGERKPEPKPEPKDVELELFGDIIAKVNRNLNRHDYSLRISKSDISDSIIFICDIIEFITGVKQPATYKSKEIERYTYCRPFRGFPEELAIEYLRDYLIQILEEKFGLKIKVCGNCANYYCYQGTYCDQLTGINRRRVFKDSCYFTPPKWIPEEIPSEKKEEEKTCRNCGLNTVDDSCMDCYERSSWRPKK